jgi:hypothetical protein
MLSGVLNENPHLEQFELIATNAAMFVNVNKFVENFEDFTLGPRMRKLTLRDSLQYTERSKFLEGGTGFLE